jgi:paraquat-inducible protein B
MTEEHDKGSALRTAATIQRSGWPGWIWAVPIAALAIVSWMFLRALTTGGVDITIRFDQAAGMRPNDTSVMYMGYQVGKVMQLSLTRDGHHIDAKVNINNDAKRFLKKDTRFWLQGASPDFSDPDSLKAVLAGPTIVMIPGGGVPARRFVGFDRRPVFKVTDPPLVPYRLSFDGDVGQLKKDAPVKLRGFTVGKVENFWLEYNAASDQLETPVIIGLEPTCFAIRGLQAAAGNGPALNRVLDNLAKQGMRAKLVQSPPLIGSYQIALDFVPDAPREGLDTSGAIASVPTAPGGGLDSIVHRVNQVPIDKIAAHVLAITTQVQSLVSSPQLQDSLKHLDRSLVELDSTIQSTGPQITDLVNTLRKTGDELDEASLSANRVLGGSPTNQDKNVKATLYELTEAARSVRMLADYLDRHPEAILKGKPSQ